MTVIRVRFGMGTVAAVGLVLSVATDALAGGGKGAPRPAAPRAAPRPHTPSIRFQPPKPPPRVSMPRMAAPRPPKPPPASKPAAHKSTTKPPHVNAKAASPRPAGGKSHPKPAGTVAHATRPRAPRATSTTRHIAPYRYPYRSHRGGVRRYRGYGYARRYVATNQIDRAVVGRLRATHASLARLDRGYGGHRAKAMRAIRRAVWLLGHTSMTSRAGVDRNRAGIAANAPMPQAQSDARMRGALRTLQGVRGQMAGDAFTPNRNSARAAVQRAIRELGLGLRVR